MVCWYVCCVEFFELFGEGYSSEECLEVFDEDCIVFEVFFVCCEVRVFEQRFEIEYIEEGEDFCVGFYYVELQVVVVGVFVECVQ